ncbi:MAG: Tim44-like domain-containing protein [Rhodocyclaceae bacterium]|nr:Tim44-like domain-containing protein [Rhodocyclaceae bacterium]
MKRIVITLIVAFFTLGIGTAEAARLGGSKSFGMSRNSAPMQKQALPPKQATPAAAPQAAPAPQSGMSRWLGPIAGLAAGIGLAAMLSHFGMGEGMANILMIALLAMAAFFVFRLLFRRGQPQPAYAGNAAPLRFEAQQPLSGGTASAIANPHVPADFDSAGFLRQAKLNFVRLQAANDAGNMDDIKTFSTPEFFAEVEMQFLERGKSKQQTDVVQLDAQLLEVATEDKRHIASVRFFGQLRETPQAAPENFDEVWHLIKPVDGSGGWSVAGIQQIA